MPPSLPFDLIGDAPEVNAFVNSLECNALVDTGSQVTTISQKFHTTNLTDVPIHNCSRLLRVAGAGGENLPYSGYVEVSVKMPVSSTEYFEAEIPVLVVPDTAYNSSVPLLIGTNFLSRMSNTITELGYLPIPVQAAISAIREHQQYLNHTKGIYGDVVAEDDVSVPAKCSSVVCGQSVITIPLRQQTAMISQVSNGLAIVPGVVSVDAGTQSIPVEVVNHSDIPLSIPKGQTIAQLHHACIQLPSVCPEVERNVFLSHFDLTKVDDADKPGLEEFLTANRDVFSLSTAEVGCTDICKHKIELTDPKPFKQKFRPIPPASYDEVRAHLAELLSSGVIQESNSPYSSNMVLVRKKDNSLRLCVDYRQLNSLTKKDAYTIPRIETLIDSLQGASYFASLDLFSGYHQVEMDQDSMEKTAFTAGPLGFFEYTRLPFGLCNAPSTFQRLMERVLAELNMKICAVYLDDVIVYAKSKNELYDRLRQVFDRFRAANLRLKPEKCGFLNRRANFLGHTVSDEGVQCSDDHISAVKNWPEPTCLAELQTFLGFTGFYRRFVAGYSSIAHPLLLLQRGHNTDKGKKSTKKKKAPEEPVPWSWGEEQRLSFQTLKDALMNAPILAYPDFSKPFELHVDASTLGLGCVLYQKDGSTLRVIAYGSRSLSKPERNYSVHKLEFLALKWAVAVKFHHYLYGKPFTVYTDHNPLAYVTTTAKLDAVGHRWLAELSAYEFSIFYKPGSKNCDADGLSRRPHPEQEKEQSTRKISAEVFKEICALVSDNDDFAGVAENLAVSPTVLSNVTIASPVTDVEWAVEQRKDLVLRRVIEILQRDASLTERQRRRESRDVRKLLAYKPDLFLHQGVMYKKSKSGSITANRLVIPTHWRQEVLRLSHDEIGHLGREKTLSVARDRYFWVGLAQDVEDKIRHCPRCIRAKTPHLPERAPLTSIRTSRPLELVCMDFLSLETSTGGHQYVLVITDHFTKYACAFPTRNQEAKTVAKILVDNFIVHYGLPERIHSDQGGCFEGKVVKQLCSVLGISKSRTTPYHPEGDGLTERMNRTLISMLKTLDPIKKANWKDYVAPLVHAYNCTRHESTGQTPFFLMFGRTPRMPIDVFLKLPTEFIPSVESMKQRLQAAYEAATYANKLASDRQARNYNRKVRGAALREGDLVLVKNVGLKGKHKLADRWQHDPYTVMQQPNTQIPVYKIGKEGEKPRMLHRNMLLPLSLPIGDTDDIPSSEFQNEKITTSDDSEDSSEECESADKFLQQNVPDEIYSDISETEVELAADKEASTLHIPNMPDVEECQTKNEALQDQLDTEPALTEPNISSSDSPENCPHGADNDDSHEEPVLRRSQRTRRPPDFYVSSAQTATLSDWRDRVSILLSMMHVLPFMRERIGVAIIDVITNCA